MDDYELNVLEQGVRVACDLSNAEFFGTEWAITLLESAFPFIGD